MKQVIVKNLLGEQIAGAKMEDPSAWIADCEEHGYWGEAGSYSVEVVDITAQLEQERINREAQEYLDATDWRVLRHIRQKTLGEQPSLTETEYLELEQTRSLKAKSIIR